MNRPLTLIVALLTMSLLASMGIAATIYKCKDENGRTVFSQQRCANDAQELSVKLAEPTADTSRKSAMEEYQAVTDRTANRIINVEINNKRNRIKALRNERDAKILEYRKEIMRSAYDNAGHVRNQQYSQLIDATRESYNDKIADKETEIRELETKLRPAAPRE